MVATLVLGCTNFKPSSLSKAHDLEALVEIGKIASVINDDHIYTFAFLSEVNKLPIVKSGLVLVVHGVSSLR